MNKATVWSITRHIGYYIAFLQSKLVSYTKEARMEPTIIAAVVSAAGSLLGKVIELYAGNRDTRTQEQAASVIQKTYETLKGNLTDGCVRVLKLLESGSLLYSWMIRERFYPTLQLPQEHLQELDSEFRYRLEYLRLNGVVTLVAGSEYGITRLGLAFLVEARRRRDYYGELFGS